MKKKLALMIMALLLVTGISFADVPPTEPTLTTANLIIQALRDQNHYGLGFNALIVMEGEDCVIYVWRKSTSRVDLKVKLPERGISMSTIILPPQNMPDYKIIIRAVDVVR